MRKAFLIATVVTAIIFVWQGNVHAAQIEEGADDARLGRQVFLWIGCGNCHGPDARGAWKGPDLTDPQLLRVRSDQDIFNVIKHGRPDTMMAFYNDELADDQIDLIVAFLRNEGHKRQEAEATAQR